MKEIKPRNLPVAVAGKDRFDKEVDASNCESDARGDDEEPEGSPPPECPVCLQVCIHPVRLPCEHIFCFLCVKGAANQSKRCALCRREIPVDFFNKPTLIRKEDLVREMSVEEGHQWFYEGRNGWWQYDERTCKEIEEKYKEGKKSFDLLIAGFLYVLDMENMLQIRRNDPTRRRRIKRDAANTPKKGVAGLKILPAESSDREGAYGGDSTSSGVQSLPALPCPSDRGLDSNQPGHDTDGMQNNTDDNQVTLVNTQMAALSLDSEQSIRRRRTSHPPSRR